MLIVLGVSIANAGELTRQIELGTLLYRGNTYKTIFTQGANVSYNWGSETIYAREEYRLGKNKGQTDQDRLNLGLKYDKDINAKVDAFMFAESDRDKIKDIKRHQLGVGADYTFVNTSRIKESVSGAIIMEKINNDNLLRLSIRKKLAVMINPYCNLDTVIFYQPKLINFSNYLIKVEVKLTSQLTKNIGLNLMIKDEYDSQSKKKKNDLMMSNGININF